MKVSYRCQRLFDSAASVIKSWLSVTLYCVALCAFERTFTFHIHYSIISFLLSLQKPSGSQYPIKEQPSCESPSRLLEDTMSLPLKLMNSSESSLCLLSPVSQQTHLAQAPLTTPESLPSPLLGVTVSWPMNIGISPNFLHLCSLYSQDHLSPVHDFQTADFLNSSQYPTTAS